MFDLRICSDCYPVFRPLGPARLNAGEQLAQRQQIAHRIHAGRIGEVSGEQPESRAHCTECAMRRIENALPVCFLQSIVTHQQRLGMFVGSRGQPALKLEPGVDGPGREVEGFCHRTSVLALCAFPSGVSDGVSCVQFPDREPAG